MVTSQQAQRARARWASLPANNGVTFPRAHYERMGHAAAETRRQERLLVGRPVWALLRERRWADALLFGRPA